MPHAQRSAHRRVRLDLDGDIVWPVLDVYGYHVCVLSSSKGCVTVVVCDVQIRALSLQIRVSRGKAFAALLS